MKKYYEPHMMETEDGKKEDLNDLYPEFKRYESKKSFTFLRLYFGFTFLVWWRFILFVCTLFSLSIALNLFLRDRKPGDPLSQSQRRKVEIICSIAMFIVLNIVLGLFYKEKKITDLTVFKKYLGPDYKDRDDYSLIISNHTSYTDIFVLGRILVPSFAAKAGLKTVPIIGFIAESLESLWIHRDKKEQSDLIHQQMHERQKDFISKKLLSPLLVFPEGTVTSGRHLLIFRSGAFRHQLPVKPYILVNDSGEGVCTSTGGMNQGLHWLYILCFLYTYNLTVYELPTIYPTDYMYEHHTNLVENKTHVYANTARSICAELSGLQKSDKTVRHSFEFDDKIRGNTSGKEKLF